MFLTNSGSSFGTKNEVDPILVDVTSERCVDEDPIFFFIDLVFSFADPSLELTFDCCLDGTNRVFFFVEALEVTLDCCVDGLYVFEDEK